MTPHAAPPTAYDEAYYRQRCGGVEFFERYGDRILKPQHQAALLAATLTGGEAILDLGCGRGEMASHLRRKGHAVTALDTSPDAVALARKTFPGMDFRCGDLHALGEPRPTFDVVFFLGTIEHLTDAQIEETFSLLRRWVKPGGRLVLTTCVNRLYYKVWTYRWRVHWAVLLTRLGIHVRKPLPPRSEEDETLHINEQTPSTLRRLARRTGWVARVCPQPNPKLISDRLYGPVLPPDWPTRRAPSWRQKTFQALFQGPLRLLLARSYLVLGEKADPSSD
jgi:SAM-dependent methyltransferase